VGHPRVRAANRGIAQLHLSNAPGFGVSLAPNLEQRFPYVLRSWALPVDRPDVLMA
jgi:hypothetical protein